MSEQFGRRVILQIGQPNSDGREVEGVRIQFTVKRDTARSPNEASITAYGLAPASLRALEAPGTVVRLLAGYESRGGPRLIFRGEPIRNGIRVDRRKPNPSVTIDAKDGRQAEQLGRINETFGQQTTSRQAIDAIAAALGLPADVVSLPAPVTYPHGVALVGPAAEVLDVFTAAAGAVWFIRDGRLVVISADGNDGQTGPLFSPASGLIGSPVPTKDGVEVTVLLDPALREGRKFALKSRDTSGLFVARSLEFYGDSGFDAPFYARVIGRPAE